MARDIIEISQRSINGMPTGFDWGDDGDEDELNRHKRRWVELRWV